MVYASMIESVLEAGNQKEDTFLSSLRKKLDLHGFADDHAMKRPLRPLIDKLKH